MPSKLTEGLIPNIDACKTGAGLSRGPNLRKKLVSSAWSQTWPAPGATLDLDFVNNRGYIFGQGQGGVMDAISFTRASSGTWVGPDGLLKNGGGLGKNLLTFPQDFDNAAWIKSNTIVTTNAAVAPDGTLTAENIIVSSGVSPARIYQNYPSVVADGPDHTASFYVKSNGFRWIYIYRRVEAYGITYFDIIDGVVGNNSHSGYTINNVGNGWYRVSITGAGWPLNLPQLTVGVCDANNNTAVTGDNTKGISIWGAQLELGSTATQYYPTNVNTPRFDWASVAQITNRNLLNYTELLTNAYWFKTNLIVSASTVLGDGSFNLVPSNGTFASGISYLQNSGWRANAAYTFAGINTAFSFYVAANGANYIQATIGVQPNRFAALNIDLTNGTATTGGNGGTVVSYTITPQTIGYYVTLVVNISPGTIGSTPSFFISTTPMTPGFSPSITGNGTSGVVIKYPQFEVGSTSTSYQAIGSASPSTTPLTPTSTSNGILIEEQRTNLLLWSRDATQTPNTNLLKFSQTFTNAVWSGATGLTGSQQLATGTGPLNACISVDGTSVYVINYNSSSLSTYNRNTSTGALTSTGTIATGTSPQQVCISADGTSVYVTTYATASNSVSIYTRNTSTGALTANGSVSTTNPVVICISSDGTSVYAANNSTSTISIYTRNTSTGALTANGTIATGTNPTNIAISADGLSVYATNSTSSVISIYTRNTSTGVLTANGTVNAVSDRPIAISADGKSVYVPVGNTIALYTRNTSTGALTANGTIATGTNPQGICISADGTFVYVVNFTSNTISIYTRNITTGALTANGNIVTGVNPIGIIISADGNSVYATNNGSANISTYSVVKGSATVVDNTFAAPDSTTTAATVTATTAGAALRQTTGTSIGPYTFSIYIYRKTGTGNVDISFDGNTFTTQPVTSVWTRYSISGSNVINPTFGVSLASAGDEVYVWGAQLNYGLTPTTYETTTSSVPIWSKQNITVALNQTGIDGVANSATSITATAANGACIQHTISASSTKTISVYLKAITVTGAIQVSIDGSTGSIVDLSNGLWNRIALTATIANPVLGILIQNSGDVIAMDYGQMETASFATTPIFTSSSTATRATDFATIPNNITKNFFNWNSGAIFAKGAGIPVNTSGNIVNIGDGTYYRGVALNFAGSLVVGLTRTSDSFTFPGASATNLPYSLTLYAWNSFSLAGSWSMSRVSASIFGRTAVFANNVGYAPLNYGAYFFDISSAAGNTPGTNCKYFSRIILWPKAVSDSAVQLISGETT
jgi:6-phosphogluconolactonase (cycloisomerase 2 family)